MKKSALLMIMLISLILTQCKAQSVNNSISNDAFNNILFNEISLGDIINTNGSEFLINNLSNLVHDITETGEDINELRRTFEFENDLLLIFKGLSPNQVPELIYINTSYLEIDGVEFSVGDHVNISDLDYIINPTISGDAQILFSNSGGDCCIVSITFDAQSGLIEKLEYIVYT